MGVRGAGAEQRFPGTGRAGGGERGCADRDVRHRVQDEEAGDRALLLGAVGFALAVGRYDVGVFLWLELAIALANGPHINNPGMDDQRSAAAWSASAGAVYLADCAIRDDVETYAMDPERAARLWEISEKLCG